MQSIDQRIAIDGVNAGFGSTIAQRGRAYGFLAQATMQSRCCAWRANWAGLWRSRMAAAISLRASVSQPQTKCWHCRFEILPEDRSFLGRLESDRRGRPVDSQLRTGLADTRGAVFGRICPPILACLGRSAEPAKFWLRLPSLLGLPDPAERAEQWLAQMHAPTGLDLGAETPAAIALSIIAEIQQTLNNGSALPLRQVRAVQPAMSRV